MADLDTSHSIHNNKRKLKLPKIELKKFGGDIKDWLGFWSQFRRIHDDTEIETEDKFQYLIQATIPGTRAREIVESFPPTAENYGKVVDSLKQRFGREELQIEYYVRELLGLVVQNVSSTRGKLTLSRLYDRLESHLRALESIGVVSEKYAAMLFPLVESCLPEDILKLWIRSPAAVKANDGQTDPAVTEDHDTRLERLLSFLRKEVEGEERVSLAQAGFKLSSSQREERTKPQKREGTDVPTALSLMVGEVPRASQSCVFCEKGHESKDCMQAQKMPLSQKKSLLSSKKCCFLCFRLGHRSKFCRANIRCVVCGKRHPVLMCPDIPINQEQAQQKTSKDEQEAAPSVSLSCRASSKQVALQTLLVRVKNGNREKIVRALIDSGSQRSYLLSSTGRELGCVPTDSETLSHSLFGGSQIQATVHGVLNLLVSDLEGNYSCQLNLLDQPTICEAIPKVTPGPWLKELEDRNIRLTDLYEAPKEIELLIGSDAAGSLLTGEIYKVDSGPVAVQTLLGWVLMGTIPGKQIGDASQTVLSLLNAHAYNSIENLWRLDVLGIGDPVEKKTRKEYEAAALDHFERTVKILPDGRYEVELPWIEDPSTIECNRATAKNRCLRTTDKLIAANRLEDYTGVLNEWEKEGIVEAVPSPFQDEQGYYLPHRAVFKENSTTKVRPVFDASSRAAGSASLNDCLEKGPNLIELIPSAFLRFREDEIGVVADIRKAFLQISVCPEDRDYLRFLWWEDFRREQLKTFRHCRVVFGVNCSPFLLNAVLLHLFKHAPQELRSTAEKLKTSFYVDNCITSVSSEQELSVLIREAKQLLALGKFDLRGWEHSREATSAEVAPTPVLGLLWDKCEDVLFCDLTQKRPMDSVITRRTVLSAANSVFDPLGLCCPVALIPRLLLQESWKKQLSWDAPLPSETQQKFLDWVDGLPLLGDVKIPRSLSLRREGSLYSFHVFCDASQLAYATVIFLRAETRGEVHVSFVQAKCRVAPLKAATIPRLELMACCIGVRLAKSLQEAIDTSGVPFVYWSDSSTALCWIKGDRRWGTFVQNRVTEIRSLTETDAWRFVPGENNPADVPSRGCSARDFLQRGWWHGPDWLRLPPEAWPGDVAMDTDEQEVNQELCRGLTFSMAEVTAECWYTTYFSRYSRIVRMIAWILRFIHNCRQNSESRRGMELTVMELEVAERHIIKLVQTEAFGADALRQLQSLKPFRDPEGIIRVQTVVSQRQDTYTYRNPAVLPSDHVLVKRLIFEEHERMSHAGVSALLASLRERFWVLRGRRTVRRVVQSCVKCKRHDSKALQTMPALLPENRVREAGVFEVVGMDLAGPLFLRHHKKVWVLLFTCAVFRAVHLELVSSLSTASFLLGFRRFIARRGRPKIVYTDNGTNFVGAANLLKTLDWTKIVTETGSSRIEWNFSPPAAPWWGGWWERMVQLVKRILRRVLGSSTLEYEELQTILCDCETTINARPLTYLSEDPEDLAPLTPAMFLQDLRVAGVPDLDFLDRVALDKRFKYQQRLRDDLRRRFRAEYLGQLALPRRKNTVPREIGVGDVVLIGDDTHKRVGWPLARVIEVYPGRDGCIRVVKLKTASGSLVRPVRRLFPLEVTDRDDTLVRHQVEATGPPEDGLVAAAESAEMVPDANPDMGKPDNDVTSTKENKELYVTKRGRTVKPNIKYST